MEGKTLFYIFFGVAVACGLVALIVLVYYLTDQYSLKWDKVNKPWIHGFVMWMGLIFFHGLGLVVHRILLPKFDKKIADYTHIGIHVLVFIMSAIGLDAIFDVAPKHLKTVHGVFGLITVLLYCLMIAVSLIIYLIPQISQDVKKKFSPYHINIGVGIFLFSVVTSSIGLNILSTLKPDDEPILIAVMSLAYSVLIFILVITVEFKQG